MNKIIGLPPPFLLSCFISGLTLEIRCEVQALQSLTLVQAASLARLQEEKLLDGWVLPQGRPPPTAPVVPSRSVSTPTPLLPSPPHLPPPVLKCLSLEEITSRYEHGLCFNCNEKYHRGHCCASRVFLLVANEEDFSLINIESLDPPQTRSTILTRSRPKLASTLWRIIWPQKHSVYWAPSPTTKLWSSWMVETPIILFRRS